MTFDEPQQKEHRAAFINECRQKAWGAACHADWISKQLDGLVLEYQKLQAEDRALHEQNQKLSSAFDSHTSENQEKRKALRERRTTIGARIEALQKNVQQGQLALTGLYSSAESSLALAKHAETWKWKEVEAKTEQQSVAQ